MDLEKDITAIETILEDKREGYKLVWKKLEADTIDQYKKLTINFKVAFPNELLKLIATKGVYSIIEYDFEDNEPIDTHENGLFRILEPAEMVEITMRTLEATLSYGMPKDISEADQDEREVIDAIKGNRILLFQYADRPFGGDIYGIYQNQHETIGYITYDDGVHNSLITHTNISFDDFWHHHIESMRSWCGI